MANLERYCLAKNKTKQTDIIFSCFNQLKNLSGLKLNIAVDVGQCKHPGIPTNGSVISNHDKNKTFEFGAIVQYTCDTGFYLLGSPLIQCVVGFSPDKSIWNASTPVCKGRLYISQVASWHMTDFHMYIVNFASPPSPYAL